MENSNNANDDELKKLNIIDETSEEENENESEEEDQEAQNKDNIYNKNDFTLDKLMAFFFNNEVLARVKFCPKYDKQITLETNLNYKETKV